MTEEGGCGVRWGGLVMAIRRHVRLKEAAAISPPVRKHSLERVEFQQLRCDSSPDDK